MGRQRQQLPPRRAFPTGPISHRPGSPQALDLGIFDDIGVEGMHVDSPGQLLRWGAAAVGRGPFHWPAPATMCSSSRARSGLRSGTGIGDQDHDDFMKDMFSTGAGEL